MAKPIILIVDDDPDFLSSTVAALNSLDRFKILTASNSDEAFKLLKRKAVDVLVVDYLLGQNSQYNGDGIISVVRSEENNKGRANFLPCILITGSEGEEEMKPDLMNLKANYIKKSKKMADKLVNLIDGCIKDKKVVETAFQPTQSSSPTAITPWKSGLFYVFTAVVVIMVIAVISRIVTPWIMPLILISAILLVAIIGGLQLRHDEKLKDESFLKLMIEALKQLAQLARKTNPPKPR